MAGTLYRSPMAKFLSWTMYLYDLFDRELFYEKTCFLSGLLESDAARRWKVPPCQLIYRHPGRNFSYERMPFLNNDNQVWVPLKKKDFKCSQYAVSNWIRLGAALSQSLKVRFRCSYIYWQNGGRSGQRNKRFDTVTVMELYCMTWFSARIVLLYYNGII